MSGPGVQIIALQKVANLLMVEASGWSFYDLSGDSCINNLQKVLFK